MSASAVAPIGSTQELIDVAQGVAREWDDLDAPGTFWARNLDTGAELGFEPDRPVPLASLVKLPLALVVADRCATGALDPAHPVTVAVEGRGPGPTGISALRHPVTMALGDLVTQMLAISDNAAADALLDLVGLEQVGATLRGWGVEDVEVRHRVRAMYDYATRASGDDFSVATHLAVTGGRPDGGHAIESLDVHRANVGTARALVDLLDRTWDDAVAHPDACATVRSAMARQPFVHRLASDLLADDIAIASKTATFLTLRHEVGVVTHGRDRVAVAALTTSRRRARVQADVDLAIGRAARSAFEALRSGR